MTELLELFSAVVNRALPESRQAGVIGALAVQVTSFFERDGEGGGYHAEALRRLFPGVFDAFDFSRARNLTTAVVGNGELPVLVARLQELLPAASDIFRAGPRSSSPISEIIAAKSSKVSSLSKDEGLVSSDVSTQKSGSPVKREELEMKFAIDALLVVDSGGTIGEQASLGSDADTEVDSSLLPSDSDGGAVASVPQRSAGLYTLVDRLDQRGEQLPQQGTSSIGTTTAEENAALFGEENGNDTEN